MSSFRSWVSEQQPRGAFVATTVGSVTEAKIRLAHATAENKNEIVTVRGCHEITSLVGTLSVDGLHIHITLSDKDGKCIGGHLIEAKIFTTAEVLLGCLQSCSLRREHDSRTGFDEMVVKEDPFVVRWSRFVWQGAVFACLGAALAIAMQRYVN